MNAVVRNMIVLATLALLLGTPVVSAHSNRDELPLLPPSIKIAPEPSDAPTRGSAASSNADYDDDDAYGIRFSCPTIQNQGVGGQNANPRCPADVIDPLDIMGQPVLLMDPKDPTIAGFNALHGGHGLPPPGKEPPTNQSRDNILHQPHTTFYTFDGAHEVWNDHPYYSPMKMPDKSNPLEDPITFLGLSDPLMQEQIFGTDNAAVLDAQGNVYLASLYAFRNASMQDWAYAIGFWKSGRLNRAIDYFSGYVVKKFPEGVVLDSIHAVYVKESNRVAVVWREVNETKSYINFAYTEPGKGGIWYYAKETQRIGPCMGITNPVAYYGKIYLGCFGDKGYAHVTAVQGTLHMHAIETMGNRWTTSFVDSTTIKAPVGSPPNAILQDIYDGHFFIMSGGVERGQPFLHVAKSSDYAVAAGWDPPFDLSRNINGGPVAGGVVRPAGVEVVEARVNAGTFILRSGNIHMIWFERWKVNENQQNTQYTPEYYKALVSVNWGDGKWNGMFPLGVDAAKGTGQGAEGAAAFCQAYEARYAGPNKDVFNDLKDSLISWFKPHTNREQRTFIAYADCGNVRFAEVHEEDFPLFPLFFSPPTPAIAAPLAAANPAQVGVVAGALAGAMVLRMLAFKRKLAVEAPA